MDTVTRVSAVSALIDTLLVPSNYLITRKTALWKTAAIGRRIRPFQGKTRLGYVWIHDRKKEKPFRDTAPRWFY